MIGIIPKGVRIVAAIWLGGVGVAKAEVPRPGTPTIEILQEMPQLALEKQVELFEEIVTPEDIVTFEEIVSPEYFRPYSDTLTGVDPKPDVTRPNYLQSVEGMDSDIKITRITPDEDFGAHSYSKRQTWNADETRLDIKRKILDAEDYSVLLTHTLSTERNWSTTNPDLIYGVAKNPDLNNSFAMFNIVTQERTIFRTFHDYQKCTIGDYEGNLSNDDRYVLLSCAYSNGTKDLISYDIQTDTVLGKLQAEDDLNWASYSQSGAYIVVENNAPGQSVDRELLRYDRNLQNKMLLTNEREHGDFGFDDEGNDVYVMIAWDKIEYIRLKDAARFDLGITDRAGNGHVSCRAFRRPGWCYFSTKNDYQRLAAVKITDKNSVVEVWGFSKSTSSEYANQPKVSVSPSGRKLIFTSDWWSTLNQSTPHPGGGGSASEYVLELVN